MSLSSLAAVWNEDGVESKELWLDDVGSCALMRGGMRGESGGSRGESGGAICLCLSVMAEQERMDTA